MSCVWAFVEGKWERYAVIMLMIDYPVLRKMKLILFIFLLIADFFFLYFLSLLLFAIGCV